MMKPSASKHNINKRKLLVIMSINIGLALLDKCILLRQGALGSPAILTAVLWFFIFKGQSWAFVGYYILSGVTAVFGLLGIALLIGYSYRGYETASCLLMILMGCNHVVTALLLRRYSGKPAK